MIHGNLIVLSSFPPNLIHMLSSIFQKDCAEINFLTEYMVT